MKVYYLSTTSFADCDINILHHLPMKYDITYGVLIPRKNANYSEEQLNQYCFDNNIKRNFFRLKYRYRDPRSFVVYWHIIQKILGSKSDIVLINNFDQPYFNLLSLTLNKKKTIIAIHDVISHSGTPFNKVTALSRNLLLKKFNHFLTFSNSQAELLKTLSANRNIHMIPLALKNFGHQAKSVRSNNTTNFLFFGNIKSYKGLDILLKSINRLSKKYSSFKLTIAGRCSNWNEVYEPLIENKEFISKEIRFIDNDEISSFFSSADYLILPYRDATQSGPLMIAYNYNIPVIASNIDGFKEFVDNEKTGFLFDINSDKAIDKVLESAIQRNKIAYDVLIANIAVYKQKYLAIEHTVEAYDTLFDSVIKSQKL
jgi:glycosyltransferase involved in cell wall biosynthesis